MSRRNPIADRKPISVSGNDDYAFNNILVDCHSRSRPLRIPQEFAEPDAGPALHAHAQAVQTHHTGYPGSVQQAA